MRLISSNESRGRTSRRGLLPHVDRLDSRVLLTGNPLPNDASTILLLHLDGSLAGAAGETPLSSGGTSFVPGVIGQAVHTDGGGALAYPAPGNILPGSGTVEFWIKPDWNGSPNPGHTFLQVGNAFDNGMILSIDGASNLRFIRWGDDPATPQVESSVERGVGFGAGDWVAGKWHHFAATWDGPSHRMTLYMDGRAVASADNDVTIGAFSNSTLTIGSGAGGASPGLAAFDELRISDRTRTAGEILEDVRLALGTPPPGPVPPAGVNPDAINPKVLLFVYDPIMENKGGLRQHELYNSNDPIALTDQVIADLRRDSHGLVNYQVVETRVVDAYPFLKDGFRYDDASYDQAITTGIFHNEAHGFANSHFDYNRFLADNNIPSRILSGEIDEVWLWTGNTDAAQTWESTMAGDGAYFCNSPPVEGVPSSRAFVIMGYNFERGVGEAIHSFGHRTESMMVHAYGRWQPDQADNWSKFTLLNKTAPGLGGVGNVHFPVNGVQDYDYDNSSVVLSNADDWYNYPDFKGTARAINVAEWSPARADPQRDYLNWWYDHIPHMKGTGSDYFLANWWRYIADTDQFKGSNSNLAATTGIPTISTVSPSDGASLSGVVSIRAQAQADGALGRVDFYIDGVYLGSDTLAPYTFAWDTSGIAGRHTIVTKAYELQNGSEAVSQAITVDLSGAPASNRAPALDPIDDRQVDEGTLMIVQARAIDADAGQSLRYSLVAGAPDGMSIDAITGRITWTSAAGAGSYVVTVGVRDDGSPVLSDSKTFRVSVRNAPPTIAGFRTTAKRGVLSRIVLTFNEGMDPETTKSPTAYRLVSAGRDRRFGTRDDKTLAIRSVLYDPSARTATLIPAGQIKLNQPLRLTIPSQTKPRDLAGELLDGNRDGTPGGEYVRPFGTPARAPVAIRSYVTKTSTAWGRARRAAYAGVWQSRHRSTTRR